MRVFVVAALAASLLVPSPASTAPVPPSGVLCNAYRHGHPTTGATLVREVYAGPLLLADDDPAAPPVYGTVTCTFQPDEPHAAPDGIVVTSRTTPGVVAIEPTAVGLVTGERPGPYLCTRVDVVGGPTWFYDDLAEDWSTDDGVPCMPLSTPGGDCTPPWSRCSPENYDSIICPILALVFPPEGDIPDTWDCPPYGNL